MLITDVGHCRYCIPMEGSRPLLSAELEFFTKGTGNGKALAILSSALCILPNTTSIVPLITIFTKFDAQIIQEYVKMNDIEGRSDRWDKRPEKMLKTSSRKFISLKSWKLTILQKHM